MTGFDRRLQCAAIAEYVSQSFGAGRTETPFELQRDGTSSATVEKVQMFRDNAAVAALMATPEQVSAFTHSLTDILYKGLENKSQRDTVEMDLFIVGGYGGMNPHEVAQALREAGLPSNLPLFPANERIHGYNDGTLVVSTIGSEEKRFLNYSGQPKVSYAQVLENDLGKIAQTQPESLTHVFLAVAVHEAESHVTGGTGWYRSKPATANDRYLAVNLLNGPDDLLDKGTQALKDPEAYGLTYVRYINAEEAAKLQSGAAKGTLESNTAGALFRAEKDTIIYGGDIPMIKQGSIVFKPQNPTSSVTVYTVNDVNADKIKISKPVAALRTLG